MSKLSSTTDAIFALEQKYCANNYAPLPLVLAKGEGVYVWDVNGKRYLDLMGAYSAVSHGHCHPKLVATLAEQAKKLAVPSRAFHSPSLGPFLEKACMLTGYEKGLPMNSGAEAVETAIKAARKWGYKIKGIPNEKAEIIVCEGNFHGRTSTIISFSSEFQYRDGFGPYTPGFKIIPYNDPDALEQAITPNTAAFLVEPIQGESGIRVPATGYLKACADICKAKNVLLICDEVQTGLGRTGQLLASRHENVHPDGIILGKSLGGGLLPVSLFLSSAAIMDVFTPGDHGSTFGGNELSAAVGLRALEVLIEEKFIENSATLGEYFLQRLKKLPYPWIKEVRGKGLFIGIEIAHPTITAKVLSLALMEEGLLSKDTHGTILRIAPALIITKEQIDTACEIIDRVFAKVSD